MRYFPSLAISLADACFSVYGHLNLKYRYPTISAAYDTIRALTEHWVVVTGKYTSFDDLEFFVLGLHFTCAQFSCYCFHSFPISSGLVASKLSLPHYLSQYIIVLIIPAIICSKINHAGGQGPNS